MNFFHYSNGPELLTVVLLSLMTVVQLILLAFPTLVRSALLKFGGPLRFSSANFRASLYGTRFLFHVRLLVLLSMLFSLGLRWMEVHHVGSSGHAHE